MRVIRTAADLLNINADFLLRHSFQRGIYVVPLANNFREFLNGIDEKLDNFDYPLSNLVDFWKKRWLFMRKENLKVRDQILRFKPELFDII